MSLTDFSKMPHPDLRRGDPEFHFKWGQNCRAIGVAAIQCDDWLEEFHVTSTQWDDFWCGYYDTVSQ